MKDINRTTYFYRIKFKSKEAQFNRPSQLPEYFSPMIGEKEMVFIAELGAGPVNTIGNLRKGVKVIILASDVMQPEYQKFWEYHKKIPIVPITYQDMESLTYPDEYFDIVHCRNALDHTQNPLKAIEEMKRICKKGGWVYLAHAKGQKTRYGGMHYHNFEDLALPEFTSREEADLVINTWQKT